MTLELTNTGIFESGYANASGGGLYSVDPSTICGGISWNSYPVYVCTDKTAKAIQVLKQLEADKAIKLTSVKAFIEMVEKIASIL